MDVNIVIQRLDNGEEEKRGRRGERQTGGTDAEKKRSSICNSFETEPFKIRYLKHPSFTRYSSCRHNEGEMARGRKRETVME